MFRNRAFAVTVTLWFLIATCLPQSDEQRAWTDRHFDEVFDSLFPLNQRVGVYVAYRSHRDLYVDVPEYWFLIGHEASHSGYGLNSYLTARVRVADSASVYDQMSALHSQHPNESVAEVQRRLRLKESVFTEMSCPAIGSQFKRFQQLRFAMPRFDEIVLHPLVHEIHAQAGTGDLRFILSDQDNDLVRWALETRRALESCEPVARTK